MNLKNEDNQKLIQDSITFFISDSSIHLLVEFILSTTYFPHPGSPTAIPITVKKIKQEMTIDKYQIHNDTDLCKHLCDPTWLSRKKLLTLLKEEIK